MKKRRTIQEINRNKIISSNEKLRETFYLLEKKSLFVEISVYFKELNYQIGQMKFENDWKTYYFEFGILFSLMNIIKECYTKNIFGKFCDDLKTIYDFNFESFVKCDNDLKVSDYFGSNENFISKLRSMIIAHPITFVKKADSNVYFSLNEIWIDEHSAFSDILKNRVFAKKDQIRFKIQKYYLDKDGDINDMFSVVISNRFFGEYYSYLRKFFVSKLGMLKQEEEIKREKIMTLRNLLTNTTIDEREKLSAIIAYYTETYACDIKYGFIPFEIVFLKELIKRHNSEKDISTYLIQECINSIDDFKTVNVFSLNNFEEKSKDYKFTTYWFEEIELSESIDWDLYLLGNDNEETINEKFLYFVKHFLIKVFDIDELVVINDYFCLMCKIIRKEIALRKG